MKNPNHPLTLKSINYQMPTFKVNSKNLVHFAAFRNHIGFYPTPSAITEFHNELKSFKTSKGAIQFPLDRKIPLELIKRIVTFRVQENLKE